MERGRGIALADNLTAKILMDAHKLFGLFQLTANGIFLCGLKNSPLA